MNASCRRVARLLRHRPQTMALYSGLNARTFRGLRQSGQMAVDMTCAPGPRLHRSELCDCFAIPGEKALPDADKVGARRGKGGS